ncbi:MAG: methyltransferase domain-containing protein [Myxococcota bacterium]
MNRSHRSDGQVTDRAAWVYEEQFVPALFAPWAPRLAEQLIASPRDRVLDVATGTGVLARELGLRVPPENVTGCDLNRSMLTVAQSRAPGVRWEACPAEALPFPDQSFDAVGCQFGLMFFEDPKASIREMWRVLCPGGRMVVAVWSTLEDNEGYLALTGLLRDVCGEEVAAELRVPFSFGDPAFLRNLFEDAGVRDARVKREEGVSRFPSLDGWLHTNVRGWTLGPMVSEEAFGRLLNRAPGPLGRFVDEAGQVRLRSIAQVVTVEKR